MVRKMIQRNKGDGNDEDKKVTKVMMPQEIKVESCVCQSLVISPLLLYYPFGSKVERYRLTHENVSSGITKS